MTRVFRAEENWATYISASSLVAKRRPLPAQLPESVITSGAQDNLCFPSSQIKSPPETSIATADKQIAEMNRGKLRVFRGKLGVSAGLRGGRGLRRCVWRSLLRIGEDHLGPLSEPESLGRVKSGVCVPSSLERPPGSPAGPELPNPFVSGCALEVATFCARRLVPDRRPAQVRH